MLHSYINYYYYKLFGESDPILDNKPNKPNKTKIYDNKTKLPKDLLEQITNKKRKLRKTVVTKQNHKSEYEIMIQKIRQDITGDDSS